MAQMTELGAEVSVGGHAASDLDQADVLYVSPGVPPSHALVRTAREHGLPVSSLIALFFDLCPAPIVGITGSAGKTTTTSLLGETFRQDGREVFVGGNIGRPLLGELSAIEPHSWVVLELSSFQLEDLQASPHVAVVTNVTPNHLDRHGTMQAYWAAKGQVLAHQSESDWAILNADDAWSRRYRPHGHTLWFSLEEPMEGAYVHGNDILLGGERLLDVHEIRLRGRHNVANVLAAAAASHAVGIRRESVAAAVRAFHGVSHRLETVAVVEGAQYVNDSIATAPERSLAALASFTEPVVLIAGGRNKALPLDAWAAVLTRRVRHVVLLGEMGDEISAALAVADPSYTSISRATSMDEAVQQAARAAQPGDVVLLSPGGTSYDMYRDFEERGNDFTCAARALLGEALA